jgi:hypothetical protein
MHEHMVRQLPEAKGTKPETALATDLRVKLSVLVTAKTPQIRGKKTIDFWGEFPIWNHCALFFRKKKGGGSLFFFFVSSQQGLDTETREIYRFSEKKQSMPWFNRSVTQKNRPKTFLRSHAMKPCVKYD